jgi:hypothetical protein
MLSTDRDSLRRTYVTAWRKARANEPLEPLEQEIVEVIHQHPEYQRLLEGDPESLTRDWRPEHGETNPFLHMGLHLALREQVATDRPAGIRRLYQAMVANCLGDVHAAEHRISDCLGEAIWKQQRDGREFNPKAYLKCIKRRGAGRRPHRD